MILESVSILDEALEDKVNEGLSIELSPSARSLFVEQRLVNLFSRQWHSLSDFENHQPYLTDIYHLASARLCSIPWNQLQHDHMHVSNIRQELLYWDTTFNRHYVTLMETRLFGAFSGGALLPDHDFERRKTTSTSESRRKGIPVYVASHIYRQLCLHQDGFTLLRSQSRLDDYARELRQHPTNCVNVQETRMIKEALWALANMASTVLGFTWFMDKDLLGDILRFAEECQNLSVRG